MMNRAGTLSRWAVGLWLVAASVAALADDWPAYRRDNARSGVTAEKLSLPLAASWTFEPRHAPEPAWGDPNPRPVSGWYGSVEGRRVHFDDVFHVAVAGDSLFFGSSADNKVYCLDAATGAERWSFFTGGPVRLAPTAAKGKVYFGSDDGVAYCLQASDGKVVWQFRAAPSPRRVLGHGKLISLWPVRTGVLVDGGVAYLGAGIFPAEGVYVYAVNAETGKLLWCYDRGGADPQSRTSPQGYLLASKTALFVPTGRVSPASLDRVTGKLLNQPYHGHDIGGTNAQLADDLVVTGTEQMVLYTQKTPNARLAWFRGRQVILTRDVAYMATETELAAFDRRTYPKVSLAQQTVLNQRDRLVEPLAEARGNAAKLQTAIKEGQETLKALGQQSAALEAKGADAQEIARVKADRDEAAKTLEKDTRALDGAKKGVAKLQDQMKSVQERIKTAQTDIAATSLWRTPIECPEALILAGGTLVAGGKGKVVAVDAATGKAAWSAEVKGTAKGLAIAKGRLYVSTDSGQIACFAPAPAAGPKIVKQTIEASPFPKDDLTAIFEAAAEHIVRSTGITRGYCLLLGSNTGRLAYELARRTELRICAVYGSGETNAAAARKALDAAGLYGTRITIESVEPPALPYPDYFANLIVSEGALTKGLLPFDAKDAFRCLKPLGGQLAIGQPAAAKGEATPLAADTLRQWLAAGGMADAKVTEADDLWASFTRGPLPGAGSWTHEYAEPGNTTCGDDQLVKCPLGVLWFGEPGPEKMVERHVRVAAPLAVNGRFIVQGVDVLMAYDSYNGLKLWERAIPGAARIVVSNEASNMVANADSVFLVVGDKCLRLDAATGETKATYSLPPTDAKDGKKRTWGYLACVGNTLFGSRSAAPRSAECLFALDVATGNVLWSHNGKSIPHSSISIACPEPGRRGDGQVMFIEMAVTPEQRQAVLKEKIAQAEKLVGNQRLQAEKDLKAAAVRGVVALDAATGKPIWQKAMDLTGCGGGAYYCALGSIYSKGVLLLFGVYSDGHFWKQFFAGQFGSRRVVALDAKAGSELWTEKIGYRVRPLVVGNTLHAEPWAFDLRTGKQRMRPNPLTGKEEPWQWGRPGHHCGCPAATEQTLFFRSFTLGYYDLVGDYGTMHFGGQRPGCWINFIPANGLLLMPEASSGCLCPFPNMCTVVLKSADEGRAWAWYSAAGPITPTKHLALNLGAPGDRRDAGNNLWLGYPRPSGSLNLRFNVPTSLFPGGEYFVRDPALVQVAGTDTPWLFHSGIRGLRQAVVPLSEAGEGLARYTVRLAFADLDQDAVGKRVFDIKLQDRLVERGFDVVKAAGGGRRAVIREFKGIEARGKLKIDFATKASKPTPEQMPILQAIEIVREEVLSLGLAAPAFVLSDGAPEQAGEVRVTNTKDAEFTGILRAEAPDGFTVTPAESPVKLAAGEKGSIALKAAVAKAGKRGKVPVVLKLLRADGSLECEAKSEIEYLGGRARVVLKAVEDAYVDKGFPTANLGSARTLLVDGGDAEMGDQSYQATYLKFRLAVPGKPVSATLRITNAGNPTGDSGNVCLVADPWKEREITFEKCPKPGRVVAKLGAVSEDQVVEAPLNVSLKGLDELSLAIVPVNLDGVDYFSREGGKPAELVVEYEKGP